MRKMKLVSLGMLTVMAIAMTGCGQEKEDISLKENEAGPQITTQSGINNSETPKSEETSTTQEASTAEETATTDDNTDIASQIQVIADNMATWKVTDWSTGNYMVSDLDQDGKLELVQSSLQGTGMYSYNQYYEVNDAGDGLTAWTQTAAEEGGSLADIVMDSCSVYYDSTNNLYYYMEQDILRVSATEGYTGIIALSVKDNAVTEETIASASRSVDEAGTEQVEYSDGKGETISEEAYNAMADSIYGSMEKKTLSCGWQTKEDYEMDEMSSEDIVNMLTQSYEAFSIQ